MARNCEVAMDSNNSADSMRIPWWLARREPDEDERAAIAARVGGELPTLSPKPAGTSSQPSVSAGSLPWM